MRYVGKGNILDQIKAPGDFGWAHGLKRVQVDGVWIDQPSPVQFAHHCPKLGVCIQDVTLGEAVYPFWHWDGNEERPTLTPSVHCDHSARCGFHKTLTAGEWT